MFAEGSLEVKLPTIWTDEKQRWEESEKRREEEKKRRRKKIKKEKVSEDPSTFPSQNVQSTPTSDRTTFGSCDVEKVLTVAVRSTCPSQNVQNVQNTAGSDHFWKL